MEWDFTINSFKRIYDYENRKSNNVDNIWFSTEAAITDLNAFSKAVGKLSPRYKKGNIDELLEAARTLYDKINSNFDVFDTSFNWDAFFQKIKNKEKGINKEVKIAKSLIKRAKFNYLEDNIFTDFENTEKLKIKANGEIAGKQIYTIEKEAKYFFLSKVLQNKIKQVYDIHPTNRHLIIAQLKELLGEPIPKIVVRGDIKNFYESINFNEDIEALKNDHLLSSKAINILYNLYEQYKMLSKSDIGIPRGIGVSAYIAEYHMKKFDDAVRKMDNLLLYARFVDDFVAVFSLNSNNQEDGCLIDTIRKEILKRNLEPHDDSSEKALKAITFLYDKKTNEFSFLGYKFKTIENDVRVGLSESKIKKYENKIDRIFKSFFIAITPDEQKMSKRLHLLFLRLNMLTRGYYLLGYKGRLSVSVKSSYPLLDDLSTLDTLDEFLRNTTEKSRLPQGIKDQLYNFIGKHGFKNGYESYSPLVISAGRINEAKIRYQK